MVEGRFSSYLEQLRRELYLRFGRTQASWMVQQILTECRGHLEDSHRDLVVGGVPDSDAAAHAVKRFGSPQIVAHAFRNLDLDKVGTRAADGFAGASGRGFTGRPSAADSNHQAGEPGRTPIDRLETENMLSALLRDFRFALRGLRRAPGFTLAFVVTLGLGIGANTAIFSVINGVLLRPLPYRDGHELVYVRQTAPLGGVANALFSVPEIHDVRDGVTSFDGVAEFSALPFTMLGFDEPRRVRAGIVTGNYFEVMGLDAAIGRVIGIDDDGEAADPVLVLTHEYWLTTFGGDPDVIGEQIQMNGMSVQVVGIAAPAPPYPEETDIYVNMVSSPHHLQATMQTDRIHRMTEVFARLAEGETIERARIQVRQVAERMHAENPEVYDETQGYTIVATPLQRQLASRAETVFLLLLGAAGFVLLIACANVANLTLARVLRRRAEMVVRASLGAGAGALRRQLLMENLVPSLLGAALGLVVARIGLDLLVSYASRYSVRATEISIDATVFGVTLAVGLVAASLFALIPRLPSSRGGGSARRATAGVAGRTMQRGLVVVQVAVCFVLLIGAGLLLRTLLNLNSADSGLELDTVLTMTVPTDLGVRNAAEEIAFFDTAIERIGALPGVDAVGLSSWLPLSGAPEGLSALLANFDFDIEGFTPEVGTQPRADHRVSTPGYFDTLGMRIQQGRGFDVTDNAESAPVVIINETLARRYFADREPVGQRIRWTDELVQLAEINPDYRTVIGVVSDSNDFGIDNPVPHVVFIPFAQHPGWSSVLFVRSARPATVALPAVETIHALDPQQPVIDVVTLAQVRADAIAPQRLNATLISTFAILAVVIAAVGVAGVLAFSVSQRTQELGVRAALGADRRRLVITVLTEGAVMVIAGLLLGGAAAFGLTRLASGLLFEVTPTDAPTFVAVAAALAFVALAAAWLPARRASRIDPATALRN